MILENHDVDRLCAVCGSAPSPVGVDEVGWPRVVIHAACREEFDRRQRAAIENVTIEPLTRSTR